MDVDRGELDHTLGALKEQLLGSRNSAGVWEGRLSGSALSTAVAVFALSLVDREKHARLIDNGLEWLVSNQNEDGGWGDTGLSLSNVSTTMLVWATLTIADSAERGEEAKEIRNSNIEIRDKSELPKTEGSKRVDEAICKAEVWLSGFAGSLLAGDLGLAVGRKYGRDRTFSVPILTMCALAGRLGEQPEAWRLIKALPFELAVFPHRFYSLLRLPVVSYALPALIAMGQVHYYHRKPRNPVVRLIRMLARNRTLKVLEKIQPENGGFLEAAPLTGFVVMSLAAAGLRDNEVTKRGVEFLINSAREDGSWPIDTNLSTWVTTLSVNALVAGDDFDKLLDSGQREKILQMLLDSQYKQRHPYTHAAPGGWAWTALAGAVPDADDTAGALIALKNLAPTDERAIEAASAGIEWLLGLQNSDGGIPTFCRGWTKLPFDRSAPDLTAHALGAFAVWADSVSPALRERMDTATKRGLKYLESAQKANGVWVPLWFGNEDAEGKENPVYGTARVLLGLFRLGSKRICECEVMVRRAVGWLVSVQNADGGWGGDEGIASSIEETALAVDALAEYVGAAACADKPPGDRLHILQRIKSEIRNTKYEINSKHEFPNDPNDNGGRCPPYGLKSEIRNPKYETNSKTEFPNGPNKNGARNRILQEAVREAVAKGAGRLMEYARADSMTASPIGLYFAKLWYYEDLYPFVFAVSALQKVENVCRVV